MFSSSAEDIRVATAYGMVQLILSAKLRIIFELTKCLVLIFDELKEEDSNL